MRLLPFSLFAIVGAYVIRKHEPQQAPLLDMREREERAPGIGIHLTTSYATAAIRYENGTLEDLFKIEAGAEYIDLMTHWADPASKKRCETKWEELQCDLARKRRDMNKLLGRPATPDVAILASMIQDVKVALQNKLQTEIKAINPVFPILAGLETEDIRDALEYVDLEWPTWGTSSMYYETSAVYVASGAGLCKHWESPHDCYFEEMDMPWERSLFLSFDNSSFSAVVQMMQCARWQNIPDAYTVEPSLGWWNLPMDEIPREKFWKQLREVILETASERGGDLDKVFLLGNHGFDPEFREVVEQAIREIYGESRAQLMLPPGDRETVAARGAAEWAFRAVNFHWDASEAETGTIEL